MCNKEKSEIIKSTFSFDYFHIKWYLCVYKKRKIPEETMRTLIDSAIDDYEMGRCTPHSQMDIWVKERMGWK